MAAKGNLAKENLIDKFMGAVGKDYIGCFDKKYYFWSYENGEKIQVCVALTCPKNPVGTPEEATVSDVETWDAPAKSPVAEQNASISEEEQNNIRTLMEKLGL